MEGHLGKEILMAQEEWTKEEIEIVIDQFKRELDKVKTDDALEDFIKNTNKGRIKQFLQDNLQSSANGDRRARDIMEVRAVDKEALKDKINRI